jgi:hypothetical protein
VPRWNASPVPVLWKSLRPGPRRSPPPPPNTASIRPRSFSLSTDFDLAWTWPWRRRRSELRFQASRLLGEVAAADPDAEVTISAGAGSTVDIAYRELMDELERERGVRSTEVASAEYVA